MFSRYFFYSVDVLHVKLMRASSIFRVPCSVTFDHVRDDGEGGWN